MKWLGVVTVLMLANSAVSAQIGFGGPVTNKVYVGGGGSFGAGTNSAGIRYSYYSVFPIVGYRITPQLSAGTGVNYQHYGFPDYGSDYSYYQLGISPFLRYNFNQLFFQTEYDIINSPSFYDASRSIYNRLLFGVGYSQPFSSTGRGAINAMAMYDVLYKQPSVFNSPVVIRVFVTF